MVFFLLKIFEKLLESLWVSSGATYLRTIKIYIVVQVEI